VTSGGARAGNITRGDKVRAGILEILARDRFTTGLELARALHRTPGTISYQLGQLEAAGAIIRAGCACCHRTRGWFVVPPEFPANGFVDA
jgi:DNA-binding Lrp family transcriptional regulator